MPILRHCFGSLLVTVLALISSLSMAAAPPEGVPTPLKGMDLSGKVHVLVDKPNIRATGLVFLSTQCPISNKYIPELNRLAQTHQDDGVRLFGVISDPTVTRTAANQYAQEYQIAFPILFDASGELANRLSPTMTPEAIVLDRAGAIQYRGRIDDLWVDLRKQKLEPSQHDLADALKAVAAGHPPMVNKTPTIGCFFEAWNANPGVQKVTFTRDIAPILNANCVQCHRTGEIGPFPLTSFEDAAKHAKQMARVTDDRLMPPWKAEPGFGHFMDERRLSEREVALLSAWSKTGTPQGDPADLPAPVVFSSAWTLGEPDAVLEPAKPFTVPASGRDEYRVFSLPIDIPEDKYVVGYQFKAGSPTVVHHALIYLDDAHKARKLAEASTDGLPGYSHFGGIGFRPSNEIGGWAPGVSPYFLPDGIGRSMHKGTDVIVQVHYHPDGKEHQDTSKLALYFAKKPIEKVTHSFMLANDKIDIPAGESHYVRTARIGPIPANVTLLGVTPHMHLVGKQMKVTATKPDGTVVPLVNITDWDFRWQDQYRFVDAIKLPKGTVVNLETVYDNSAKNLDNPSTPPKRVTYGEQTMDEMCICFLQYTVDGTTVKTTVGTAGRGGMLRRLLGR